MLQAKNPHELMKIIYDVNMVLLGHARQEEMELMIGTAATESHLSQRAQYPNGPARGLFQVEPTTARDTYQTYLKREDRRDLYHSMMGICFGLASAPFFIPNLKEIERLLMFYDDYCAIFARLKYLRRPEAIPKSLGNLAEYYKRWYNTPAGAGSVRKYIRDWGECHCATLVKSVKPPDGPIIKW